MHRYEIQKSMAEGRSAGYAWRAAEAFMSAEVWTPGIAPCGTRMGRYWLARALEEAFSAGQWDDLYDRYGKEVTA